MGREFGVHESLASCSILEFVKGANGNVSPLTAIGGSRTRLKYPVNVHVDPTDRIITTGKNPNSVLIFAAGSNGNVRPAVTISGSRTKLISVTTVGGDYQGRIYATTYPPHSGYGSILVFGSQAHGNASPVADITGPKRELRSRSPRRFFTRERRQRASAPYGVGAVFSLKP